MKRCPTPRTSPCSPERHRYPLRPRPGATFVAYREALANEEDLSESVNEFSEPAGKMVAEEFRVTADSGAMRPTDTGFVTGVAPHLPLPEPAAR